MPRTIELRGKLLRTREVAELLGLSVHKVNRLRTRALDPIPHVVLTPGRGGTIRYPEADLLRWRIRQRSHCEGA